MKKRVFLFILVFSVFTVFSTFVKADSVEGDELIKNGDLAFNTSELMLPDPVFGPEYGVAAGYGSLAFDSAAVVVVDPDDETNTVLQLGLSDEGQEWSSFFRFLSLSSETVYNISIDFKIIGSTDNIGFRFAGGPALELVFLDHESKTPITGKDGWYNVQFQFDTATASYDSIALWFHTLNDVNNYALLDNILVSESGSSSNLNIGGDFEGFLDYAPGVQLTEIANSYGYFGHLSSVNNGTARVNNLGYLGLTLAIQEGIYQFEFDFDCDGLTNENSLISFYDNSDNLLATQNIISNGLVDSENVTTEENGYIFSAEFDLSNPAKYFKIEFTGDSSLSLDNLSLKELIEIPDNPFDPDKTYYETNQLIVNGDFESFINNTVFSEEQLEGAWGSVSLDGSAKIEEYQDNKVMSISKTPGKVYSSSFVITPPDLIPGDLLRLSFDYKLDIESASEAYTVINTSFVGASNTSYYTINLANLIDGDPTEGAELLLMPIKVVMKENGWATVSMDFEVSTEFLVKCNSIRWLFTPVNDSDKLLIDNVGLFTLGTELPVNNATSLEIDQDDLELNKGEEYNLTATILPSDADNSQIKWSSSDESVVTIDDLGKINAISKGAVKITVSTTDDSLTDSIVVTVLEQKAPEQSNILLFISIGVLSILAVTGITLKIKKK